MKNKMCRTQFVLGLVSWYVGLAHSWDYALSFGDQLIFYTSDGNKTDTVQFTSQNVAGIAYDEVHNRMLYVDKQSDNDAICGYYISSKENKCFVERSGRNIQSIAYDPATEKMFFTDSNKKSINWLSLKRESNNNVYGLIKLEDSTPTGVVVDSCTGYIYWLNGNIIERASLNGAGRMALYYSPLNVFSLAIDQQTQNIYYISGDPYSSNYNFYSNSLDGDNEFALSHIETSGKDMTNSKDYFYWLNSEDSYDSVWQYSFHEYQKYPKEISKFYTDKPLGIAANYKIEDQIKGSHYCGPLSSLIAITEAPGTTQRRYCSKCENYCLKGTCSVNDKGHPKCSCNAGYTGPRCEVNMCLGYCSNNGDCSLNGNSVPMCQCKGDYTGDRCEISDCLNYCVQGNCSLSDEGHPTCSCEAGYLGERCEISSCYNFCLNKGTCSLNEEDEPVCKCDGNHEGSRCEAGINDTTPRLDLTKTNITLADLLSTWRKPLSKMYLTVEV